MRDYNKNYYCCGRAVVFDSLSENLGDFYEIIHKGAIDRDLIESSDVFALFDHNRQFILARSNKGEGSLQLELRDDGLYYRFLIAENYKGDELISYLQRGEAIKSSFSFVVIPHGNNEFWELTTDNKCIRHIYSIAGLYDVSVVPCPAYQDTTSYLEIENKINIEDE